MSENTFPFESTAVPADDADAGGGRSRLLLGGALAVVVLAAGGWFVMGGGDGADDELAVPITKKAPAEAQAAAPEAVVVPVADTQPVGRNPFKALYVPPTGGGGGAGTTTQGTPAGTGTGATSGSTTGGTTAKPTGTVTGTPTTGGTTTTPPKPGSTSAPAPVEPSKEAPKYISVVSVDAANNQVTFKSVDRAATDPALREQVHVVKPGEQFATFFKLFGYGSVLDAQGQPRDCTDLLYGDARLKLCVGESYQVS